MGRLLAPSCALFLGLVVLFPAPAARAQEVQVEIAHPPVRFLTADTALEDKKIEPSGVEPIGDGELLLVVDDKSESLLVVEAATARISSRLN